MVRTPEYREASSTLMNQAYAELAAGDLRQASEKGWGATAQMLKAIAEQRGIGHESHRDLRSVLSWWRRNRQTHHIWCDYLEFRIPCTPIGTRTGTRKKPLPTG